MSQNKTVVPGMEDGNSYGNAHSNDFYSRNTNVRSASQGTVVPGMENMNDQDIKGKETTVIINILFIKRVSLWLVFCIQSLGRA